MFSRTNSRMKKQEKKRSLTALSSSLSQSSKLKKGCSLIALKPLALSHPSLSSGSRLSRAFNTAPARTEIARGIRICFVKIHCRIGVTNGQALGTISKTNVFFPF